jgi:hypothetical protein
MKLAIGAGLAAAAVICLGLSVPVSQVEAATTTCTVTTVKNFKGACPAGTKFAGGGTGNIGILPDPAAAVTPTVTPTSGPAACVKTNVRNLKNSCNAAS